MKKLLLSTILLLTACESRRAYEATFEAPKSNIVARVKSAFVYQNDETMKGLKGYSQIIICPKSGQAGRELRLEEIVDELNSEGESIFKLVMPNRVASWSWHDASPLKAILMEYGYSNLDDSEIKRLNHALHHSVFGSVLEGQGREINVLRAAIDYSPSFDRSESVNKWLGSRTLSSCDAG